jgi:hypothetical protein
MRIILVALALFAPLIAPAESDTPCPLWRGDSPFPATAEIPVLPGTTHHVVHRAVEGEYQFLLGTALAFHQGTLWASWGNSFIDENDAGSVMAGRASKDEGESWEPYQVIAPGAPGPDSHSHGVFLNHGEELWAYAARADYVSGGRAYPKLRTEAYRLEDGSWATKGIVVEGLFWPLTEPQALKNGNYIMGGLIVDPENGWPNAEAAVALSDGDNVAKWTPVEIPRVPGNKVWGETSLIVEDDIVTAIIRYGEKRIALVSTSEDFGRSWSTLRDSNLPNANSKLYAGKLSTGQWYVVFNIGDRNTLAIATGKPGERGVSKVWTIRTGPSHAPRNPGRGKHPQWSYPYAIEKDGKLYVGYSVTKEDCGLSILPVNALAID